MSEGEGTVLVETPVTSITEVVEKTRAGFNKGHTFPVEYRVTQLRNLKRMIEENLSETFEAMWHDLHKAKQEVLMSELNLVISDISLALNNINKWISPEYVAKDLLYKFSTAYTQAEPYGVVLVLSPWNYPLLLSLQPLVGVIAAGNACVLKPSELAVATSNLLAELIPKYLDPECYSVVTGGVDVAMEITKQRFDYIFFTGGSHIGKSVMRQAAEHLTPLTLELGGKSPCIVADDANIEVAGQRIMWGKCLNAGQSCVAPDYILCTSATHDRLIEEFKAALRRFFGEDPKKSNDFGRIINARHFRRVLSLLDSVRDKVVVGGDSDESERYVAPTIITNVSEEDGIMKEEVFGPLLPVLLVDDFQKAIEFVKRGEKPLAAYIFTESSRTFQAVVQGISAGAVTHNDTMVLNAVSTLPFGGVGYSGFGCYHGKFSFDTFSHRKSVLSNSTAGYLEGANNIRYPPYSKAKESDAQTLQGVSRVRSASRMLHILQILTMSAAGYPPHRNQQPETTEEKTEQTQNGEEDGE